MASSTTRFLLVCAFGGAVADNALGGAAAKNSTYDFSPLQTLLESWGLTTEYAVAVGNADGRLFMYEGGNFTMQTPIPTGSTSKWPSAMMFAGLVNDGTIGSLDDPVHKYLKYWTKSIFDPRSRVTIRMLLTFTSGFGGGHPGQESNTRAARQWRKDNGALRAVPGVAVPGLDPEPNKTHECNMTTGEISACARSIYEQIKLIGRPGHVYSYNSNHLQIAAGVAVAASGLSLRQVIDKYLLEPYGMSHSTYFAKWPGQKAPTSCPDFGGSLQTTGDDYERFLHALLSYRHPSKAIIEQSELDATPFLTDYYTLYGNYGFGHFLMCFDSWGGFTAECKGAHAHMDPGAFGFIPIIDRKHGYYLQLVSAEIGKTGSYPLSGIPEYLAVAVKKHVDAIFDGAFGQPADDNYHYHHTPLLNSLGLADISYCVDCKLHPANCNASSP